MAAVELRLNGTNYAQQPALKSVYGKRQSVLSGKLFSSYWQDNVWTSTESSRFQSKWFELFLSYEALAKKEAFTIFQDRVFT